MALLKAITDATAQTYEYHKISSYRHDAYTDMVEFVVDIFKSQETRATAKGKKTTGYSCHINKLELILPQLYAYLKTLPKYSGAEDLL